MTDPAADRRLLKHTTWMVWLAIAVLIASWAVRPLTGVQNYLFDFAVFLLIVAGSNLRVRAKKETRNLAPPVTPTRDKDA